MPRRTNGGQDLSPQDEKLLQLQQLQGAGQQQDEASNNETAGLVKMLSELYGLHEHQQIDPALLEKTQAETGLAKAHTQYYQERPEELKSRAMAAELGGLDKAYAYDSNNPEYHVARKNVLTKYGVDFTDHTAPAAKPQGEFTSTSTPGLPHGYEEFANDPDIQALLTKQQTQNAATTAQDATSMHSYRRADLIDQLRRSVGDIQPEMRRPGLRAAQ